MLGSSGKAAAALLVGMGLLTSIMAFSLPHFDPDTPLPWDMSHHYLGALAFRDALAEGSPAELAHVLLDHDLYPPGHSLLLGGWILVAGESAPSLFLFRVLAPWMLLLGVGWAARLARIRGRGAAILLAALLVAASPRLLSLAGTFLVDLPAAILAVFALLALAAVGSPFRRSLALVAYFLITATLLTKYNVGLPLIPAALAVTAWWWRAGERRAARALLLVAILALASWTAFLFLQVDGWASFLAFARNRANSTDWSSAARLRWYLEEFTGRFFLTPWLAGTALVLAAGTLLRVRRPLVAGIGVYLAVTVAALAKHPYLLDRNLVSAVVWILVLASLGGAELLGSLRSRWPRIAVGGVARAGGTALIASAALAGVVLLLFQSASATGEDLEREFGAYAERLIPLSRFVRKQLGSRESCRVIGTFNAFSPGWVQILWRRVPPTRRAHLEIDFPYLGRLSSTGLDPSPDPAYRELVDGWVRRESPEVVVEIELQAGSPLRDEDYARWNAWKLNLVQAVRNHPSARRSRRLRLGAERVVVETITLRHEPIRYLSGWGREEPWGRWAIESTAALLIPAPAAGCRVELEAASFEGLSGVQHCVVRCGGKAIAAFELSGPSWAWKTFSWEIPVSVGPGAVELDFEFSGRYPGNELDPTLRALPIRTLLISTPPSRPKGFPRLAQQESHDGEDEKDHPHPGVHLEEGPVDAAQIASAHQPVFVGQEGGHHQDPDRPGPSQGLGGSGAREEQDRDGVADPSHPEGTAIAQGGAHAVQAFGAVELGILAAVDDVEARHPEQHPGAQPEGKGGEGAPHRQPGPDGRGGQAQAQEEVGQGGEPLRE